jgi:hypothetical protein
MWREHSQPPHLGQRAVTGIRTGDLTHVSLIGAAKGNRLGWWAIAVSIVATIAGVAIGLAIIGGHR